MLVLVCAASMSVCWAVASPSWHVQAVLVEPEPCFEYVLDIAFHCRACVIGGTAFIIPCIFSVAYVVLNRVLKSMLRQ